MMKKERYLKAIILCEQSISETPYHHTFTFLWGNNIVKVVQKCDPETTMYNETIITVNGVIKTIVVLEKMLEHVNHRGHVTFIKKTKAY